MQYEICIQLQLAQLQFLPRYSHPISNPNIHRPNVALVVTSEININEEIYEKRSSNCLTHLKIKSLENCIAKSCHTNNSHNGMKMMKLTFFSYTFRNVYKPQSEPQNTFQNAVCKIPEILSKIQ